MDACIAGAPCQRSDHRDTLLGSETHSKNVLSSSSRPSAQGIQRDAIVLRTMITGAGAAKSCTSPSRKRHIHPSTPEGASWGSRHAQHIGRKSDSRGKAGGKKDRKDIATVRSCF